MDPPHGCRPLRPCLLHHPHHHLHHHHHHHPLFLHPHHHHHCHHRHHVRPNFISFPQNPQQASPIPFPNYSNPQASGLKGAFDYNPKPQILQAQNHEEVAFDEEEDDDPIFVLTDEWKEFFAKSEAKRKLERKQTKKGKNSKK